MFCGTCPVCVQHADSASIIGHLGEDESFLSDATCFAATAPCVCNTRTLHRSSAILVRTHRSFRRHMLFGNCVAYVQHADSASIIDHLDEDSFLFDATCFAATAPCVCNMRTLHRSSAILVMTNHSFQRHMVCGNCPECVQRADSASIIGHLGEDESFFPTPRVCGNCPVGVQHADSASITGHLGEDLFLSDATCYVATAPSVCNARALHRSSAILVKTNRSF